MASLRSWARGLPGAPRAHDADPARGDPRRRLRPARLPRGRATADARRRRPRLLRALQGAVRGRQLRRARLRRLQRLVAGRAAALRGQLLRDRRRPRRRRRGSSSFCSASAAIVVVYLLGRRINCRPAGLLAAFARRRLPTVHPLDRRPLQRAAGDLHPAGRGPRLPLGRRARAPASLAPARLPLRPHRADPPRVPAGRDRLRRARAGPGRPGTRLAGRAWPARRCWSRRCCCRSCPGRSATRSSSTARCRSRPAAARRSTSAPSSPPTANTSGSRRSWCGATCDRDLEPRLRGARARSNPTPLFDRVAERYPELPRDEALGKIGKQNFSDYFGEDPVGYAAMTARKVWRMWSGGIGEAMSSTAGRVVQTLIVVAGARRPRRARLAAAMVGAGRRWRRRSCSSPRSARPPWPLLAATRC